jgi:hypothetical protein
LTQRKSFFKAADFFFFLNVKKDIRKKYNRT